MAVHAVIIVNYPTTFFWYRHQFLLGHGQKDDILFGSLTVFWGEKRTLASKHIILKKSIFFSCLNISPQTWIFLRET
jgi:hypothetical protein